MSAPGYYRFPAVHANGALMFTSESDLWHTELPPAGGPLPTAADPLRARRLTRVAGAAVAAFPQLSPDGATVAYACSEGGTADLYSLPLAGGAPRRLTWEGNEGELVGTRADLVPAGWTADGAAVMYATPYYSTLPDPQLAKVTVATGEVAVLPLAQASEGCMCDGETLCFARLPFQGSQTKGYRGGFIQQLWSFDLGGEPGKVEAQPLLGGEVGTSKRPMWHAARRRLFFLSDRGAERSMNIWSMAVRGAPALTQHTFHAELEVRSASLGGDRLVYQLGAALYLLELGASGAEVEPRELHITLGSSLDGRRVAATVDPAAALTVAALAPGAGAVAVASRGQLFVAPAKAGRTVSLTAGGPTERVRALAFMPGGDALCLSDRSGELELWRHSAVGLGEPRQLTTEGARRGLRMAIAPAPAGGLVALTCAEGLLTVVDAEAAAGTSAAAERAVHRSEGHSDLRWSPDGVWLAFVADAPNALSVVHLCQPAIAGAAPVAVTSERFPSWSPAWSADGAHLLFLSERDLVNTVGSPWGIRAPEPAFARSTKVYALALHEPAVRPAWAAADELAPAGGDKTKPPKDDFVATRIDWWDGARAGGELSELPLPPADYGRIVLLDAAGRLLLQEGPSVFIADLAAPRAEGAHAAAKLFLKGRVVDVSADALLVRGRGGALHIVPAGKAPPKLDPDAAVSMQGLRLSVDHGAELEAMFDEAWRLQRDLFYDKGMHGLDWPAVKAKYRALLPRVHDRRELNDVLMQMLGELSALHAFVRGGWSARPAEGAALKPAHLGAVLARCADGWRVERLYAGDPERPATLAPLAAPGVRLAQGDVITSVNGLSLTTAGAEGAPFHINAQLLGTAGQQVRLGVLAAGRGSGEAAREVIARPLSQVAAADLRYLDWELSRRAACEELSGGSCGYVHMRAMGGEDMADFAREFYPVYRRQGLVLDVRHNRGGNIDSWVLEKLMRKAWFYWAARDREPYWNMQYAFRGHIVVLMDQETASDGEAFAEGAKRLGVATVLGMRTWGGEIWLSADAFAVRDGGIASGGQNGVYDLEGKEWLIEGYGVQPDVEVDNLPHGTHCGGDAQLEAAVAHLQASIRADPRPVPPPPAYPDRKAGYPSSLPGLDGISGPKL
jgi:tricorn protease